jgi:hypothetical protein
VGVPTPFPLFPSLTGPEEFAGAARSPAVLIAVRMGEPNLTLELALPFEVEGIVDRDVDSPTLDV